MKMLNTHIPVQNFILIILELCTAGLRAFNANQWSWLINMQVFYICIFKINLETLS